MIGWIGAWSRDALVAPGTYYSTIGNLIMSLASQTRSLAAQGATMRRNIFGINNSGMVQSGIMEDQSQFPNRTFLCYFSPVRSQEQLDAAMFKDVHDTILRVSKSDQWFDPTIGKNIILKSAQNDGTDLKVRIAELGHSGINPEYVVGCKNVF